MNRIEKVFNDLGIKMEIDGDNVLVEFWTDTSGQDIPIEFEFDGTAENFVEKFTEEAELYDVDEEVAIFINMRGKNGVPESVTDLLASCKEAKNTLMDIAEKLKDAISDKNENGKKTYAVTIKEVLSRTVLVEADSFDEACSLTEDAYKAADIVLDADDFSDKEFIPSETFGKVAIDKDDERVQYFQRIA